MVLSQGLMLTLLGLFLGFLAAVAAKVDPMGTLRHEQWSLHGI